MFELLEKFEIYKTHVPVPEYMITEIYKVKEFDLGTPKTNYGGWHSKTFTPYKDYYNGRYKWTKQFIEDSLKLVNSKWDAIRFDRAWFNMSHLGSTNRWHSHGGHPIVGVFYIQVPTGSSSIEFEKDGETYSYLPRVGDFLIFPGHLNHRVLSHNSELNSSILCNATKSSVSWI
jgi:hypothetical protein